TGSVGAVSCTIHRRAPPRPPRQDPATGGLTGRSVWTSGAVPLDLGSPLGTTPCTIEVDSIAQPRAPATPSAFPAPDEESRLGWASVRHVPWGVCAGNRAPVQGLTKYHGRSGKRRKYDNPSIPVSRGDRLGFGSS